MCAWVRSWQSMKDNDSRSINKRTELMNKCRHKWRQKLAGNRKLWTFWHNKNQVFRGYKAYTEGLEPIDEIMSFSHHLILSYMLPEYLSADSHSTQWPDPNRIETAVWVHLSDFFSLFCKKNRILVFTCSDIWIIVAVKKHHMLLAFN